MQPGHNASDRRGDWNVWRRFWEVQLARKKGESLFLFSLSCSTQCLISNVIHVLFLDFLLALQFSWSRLDVLCNTSCLLELLSWCFLFCYHSQLCNVKSMSILCFFTHTLQRNISPTRNKTWENNGFQGQSMYRQLSLKGSGPRPHTAVLSPHFFLDSTLCLKSFVSLPL